MHGRTNDASARAAFHSMIAVLLHWEPLFFRGVVAYMDVGKGREQERKLCSGGLLQNTSCVLPCGSATKRLFNFAPGKISLVTFYSC